MQINKIDNTNSLSLYGKKFLAGNAYSSLESILIRMNGGVQKVLSGDYYRTTIITKLNYNKNISLEDERRLTDRLPHNKQMTGFSVLKIGKKTTLDIDNESGEIINCDKPFYKPWIVLRKQVEKILSDIRSNFYDKNIVQQESLTVNELTPDGAKKIKKYILKIEKERLENVVKELEETSK